MGSCHSPPPDKVSKVSFWQVSLTYISTPGLKVAMWDHSFVHIKWHNFVIVIKTLPALFQNFSVHIIRPQNLPEQTIINEKNRYNMKHSECVTVTCRANDCRVGYCFAIVWSLFIDIFCFVFTVGWFVIDGDKCDSPFPDTSSGSYAQLEVSCCRKSKQHLTEGCEKIVIVTVT